MTSRPIKLGTSIAAEAGAESAKTPRPRGRKFELDTMPIKLIWADELVNESRLTAAVECLMDHHFANVECSQPEEASGPSAPVVLRAVAHPRINVTTLPVKLVQSETPVDMPQLASALSDLRRAIDIGRSESLLNLGVVDTQTKNADPPVEEAAQAP